MSADDITLGGRRLRSPPVGPHERPTVRIPLDARRTRPHKAPRAIDIGRAQEMAADILSGSDGLMKVGREGIEEIAWLVIRLDPASVIDRADDMVTMEVELDDGEPADLVG